MQVPFLDLKAQYEAIKPEIHSALQAVIDKTTFAGGPFVEKFEKDFAPFCGCSEAIGVGSGTEALWMALLALGVGPGDEVITVPNTFIATAEAISFCGATPVFVDVDERTATMDPGKLEELLKRRAQSAERGAEGAERRAQSAEREGEREEERGKMEEGSGHPAPGLSRSALSALRPAFFRSALRAPRSAPRLAAVIPVHLYGQMADMDPILELAEKYGLVVVEDACQAHGAEYKGKRAGSMGAAGAFSFYPGKNLGAYGEAGAVTTNDKDLADWLRVFRDHGQPRRYYHDVVGWNGRMDGFQGAVLGVKLKYLEGWNNGRMENAARYRKFLEGVEGVTLPGEADYARHVYHLFPIRVKNRDAVMAALSAKGIGCGIHYPVPIHFQKAYEFLGHKPGDFPVSEKIASELISLPMFPELTEDQVAHVAGALKEALSA
jgi:dTDP-4-amino-4,6-dideoxygalactose transaminase